MPATCFVAAAVRGLPPGAEVDADVAVALEAPGAWSFGWGVRSDGRGAPDPADLAAVLVRVVPALRRATGGAVTIGPGRVVRGVLLSAAASAAEVRARRVPRGSGLRVSRRLRRVLQGMTGAPEAAEILGLARRAGAAGLRRLACSGARFPGGAAAFRSTADGLHLEVADGRVRSFDPDARAIGIFALPEGEPARLLGQRRDDAPGVSLEVEYVPRLPTRLVALASRDSLRAEAWLAYFQEHDSSAIVGLPWAEVAAWVRVRMTMVRPRPEPALLRVGAVPLPPSDPAVGAELLAAQAAGRAGDLDRAAAAYQRAWVAAEARGDALGRAKARVGLALALSGQGHDQDAHLLLASIAEEPSVDASVASSFATAMVWSAILRGDPRTARQWAEDGEALADGNRHWFVQARVLLAVGERGWPRVLDGVAELRTLPSQRPFLAETLATYEAFACGMWGLPDRARSVMAGVPSLDKAPRDLQLRALAARLLVGELTPAETSARARSILDGAGARPSGWDAWGLTFVTLALEHLGEDDAARELVWARFLREPDAAWGEAGWLAFVGDGERLVRSGGGTTGTREVLEPRLREIRLAARRLRTALVADADASEDLAWLRAVLVPSAPGGWALRGVATDGGTVDVPWPAVWMAGRGPTEKVPPLTEIVARRATPRLAPTSPVVVSIADARGDLPLAAREIEPAEASLHLRGAAIGPDALDGALHAGLVHIALHTCRDAGVPTLETARGGISSLQIGRLVFSARPVVVLSGCATATSTDGEGVERSLADAFLRGGASAVLATRWPLRDGEAYELFRPILTAWPFSDVEAVVADVCTRLRGAGRPARLWSAPVVYRG